jgi:hypothetical protein
LNTIYDRTSWVSRTGSDRGVVRTKRWTLAVGIGTRKVNWVLDADVRKFAVEGWGLSRALSTDWYVELGKDIA